MKNIWIINQYTGSPYHGMNYRSYYLAKEFIKQHKVTIFSGSYSHLFTHYPKTKGLFTEENIDDIDYIWVKTPKYSGSKSIGRVLNMIVFMLNLFFFNIFKKAKPDIIIVSSLSLFPVLNAYIWSKIFNIKFIFEVRDIWPLTLVELGSLSKAHPLVWLLGLFEKLGYKKAQFVISLLPNAKKHMCLHGMEDKKFVYIPNGVSVESSEINTPLDNQVFQCIPKDKFIVGYLGTIGIANAIEYLVDAMTLIKDNENIHCVIVGKGGRLEELKATVEERNLLNITFIDAIPKQNVQSMLKLFDICYIGWHNKPIYRFGISANKIFDYMFSSKPILHSISMDNDIVKVSQSGVTVRAEDSQMIANGIIKLYNMTNEERDKLGVNGKNYVLSHHTYEQLAKKYLKLM